MLTVLDIGNTFTRIAEWNGGEFINLRRLPTAELSSEKSVIPQVAACVCPAVKEKLKDSAVEFISALNQHSKVDFSPVDCTTLGADRVANAIAVAEFYPLPAAVIDCGTALTLEVVDSQYRFVGGAIAPGRKLLRKALASGTAQLPEIPLGQGIPENIGCNTVDAIRFGVDSGIVGIVRQWITVLKKTYPELTVILTGGDAPFLVPAFPEAFLADEYFTLHGIRLASSKKF
jgi:type III pantothenate kinase